MDEEFLEPEKGDWVTYDHVKFWVAGGHDRHPVLDLTEVRLYDVGHQCFYTVNGRDLARTTFARKIKEKTAEQNFFPNVWFISDHGNAHLLELT